jgi:hypothetical protein
MKIKRRFGFVFSTVLCASSAIGKILIGSFDFLTVITGGVALGTTLFLALFWREID